MAEVADNIRTLGDQIVALTLKEAVDLGNYLKDEHGIEPAAAGVAVAAAGGGAAAEEEEAPSSFDVILTSGGAQKIKVIKIVREITGLGLKEAKDLVDAGGKPVKTGVPKEEADELVGKIKESRRRSRTQGRRLTPLDNQTPPQPPPAPPGAVVVHAIRVGRPLHPAPGRTLHIC